jgi:hypothetical protein
MLFEETEAEPTGPDLRPDTEFMWYWEEDGHRVKNHHTWDKQGNFIAYPPKVSTYLEQQWTTGQSADNLQITYKPFHSHTGFSYKVCFQDMNQINKGTGYRRKIMRRQNPNYQPPIASAEPVMATAVPIEEGMGGLAVSNMAGLPQPPEDLFSYALQSISLKDFEAKTKGTNLDHSSKAMGGTLLTWAAEFHRVDLCQSLLDRGADANSRDWTTDQSALGWATSTPVHGEELPPCDRAATLALLKARGAR